MYKRIFLAGALGLAAVVSTAYADNDLTTLSANAAATKKAAAKEGWQGSLSLGYVSTTGNTNTRSLNAQALAAYKSGPWADVLSFQALQSSSNGVTTAESYDLNGQSDYSFTDKDYVFGLLDYLRNTFTGYQRRTSEIAGYGRNLLNTPTQQIDVEFGLGARQTRYTTDTSQSEFVQRLAGSYLWKFTDKSNFSETLSVEHGPDNSFTQSVTALTTNLAGNLALSVSYTVDHNSTVLPTLKNTDTMFSVSLVNTF